MSNTMKLSDKNWTFYAAILSLILGIATVAVYYFRGGNAYSPVSCQALLGFAVAIGLNIVVLFQDFKIGNMLPFVVYSITTGILLNTEMLFISNVLTGIDGNSFDGMYKVFGVLLVATLVTSFLASLTRLKK